MAEVIFDKVEKIYDNDVRAVHDLSLEIGDGEFVVLVGPSGCGKTTALRMVAGLEDITGGRVSIGGRVVNDLTPKERDVAMVFQNYALYPHLTVADNIAFGLRLRKERKAVINERVAWAAKMLDLTPYLARRPKELSGGQRQRVAMGRAIVRQPQAFLMDEPLSNLDAKLRVQMRSEILRIQRELRVTTIYVTHDQTEAMTLGDRVAVMRKGVLQQLAPPQELYQHPANLFVAGFIGSPAMNVVEAKLVGSNGELSVEFGSHRLQVPEEVAAARPALAGFVGRRVVLGIRPEHMEDALLVGGSPPDSRLTVITDLREEMGSEVLLHFTVDAAPVLTDDTRELASDRGSEALQELHEQVSERKSPFIARASPETNAQIAEKREIFVDTRKLHFFDPETGEAIYGDRERERLRQGASSAT